MVLNLEIFPNPVREMAYIRLSGFNGKAVELSIYDSMGRLLRQQSINNPSKRELCIDLTGYDSGVYFVSARAGKKVVTKSLIRMGVKE